MTSLADVIEIGHRSVRAVNLEEDLRDPGVLGGYVLGDHVLEALRRIAVSFQAEPRVRSFSVTGPYGSGKSSFALLLCALLGPKEEQTHKMAARLLRAADPQLADTFTRERRNLGIAERGLIPAMVTAQSEPVPMAVLRALRRGSEIYWGRSRRPVAVRRLAEVVEGGRATPDQVLELYDRLVETAPVFLIIDELGKNLEYVSDHSGSDLYLLQQLAERVSSRPTFSGGVLTLAHLGFEDYLGSAGDARRREWRKVHGRFEDIPFLANNAHSISLLAESLKFVGGEALHRKCAAETEAAIVGLADACGATAPPSLSILPPSTYPLHPAVALTLPTLAAQLGQHDRSLVAYLTSDAPHALPRFLAENDLGRDIPFVRLNDLYDFFFSDGAIADLTGPDGERAREIRDRIDQAKDLDELELRVLKTLGVLNATRGGDRLGAGGAVVEEAVVGPGAGKAERSGVKSILQRLVDRSLVTYREFAGEFHVWEGSDFDARGHIAAAREQLAAGRHHDERLVEMLDDARPLRAAVARRHSQRHHVLRYFECRYHHGAPDAEVVPRSDDADGLVLYVLGGGRAPKGLPSKTADGRPLIVVWSPGGKEVLEAALDFAAASSVMAAAPELGRDVVARREMRHRVVALQSRLVRRLDEAFDWRARGVRWYREGVRVEPSPTATFARLLSELCDERYPLTPVIRNEMVNRSELTTQGAKARRILLERMFTNEDEETLGIEGYGPERSMYESILNHTGLHARRDGNWSLGPPPADSDLAGVWRHLMKTLDKTDGERLGVDALYRQLTSPPFGMKVGPLPILLAAALQYRAEDLFLYQDGSFQPMVEPAHIERLLKAPERFAIKRASLAGVRASVFDKLRETLLPEGHQVSRRAGRNETTLSVVRPLIAFGKSLPDHTRNTANLSETARGVCDALLGAREPDELLFRALPEACGVPAFSPGARRRGSSAVGEYIDHLRAALAELVAEYPSLLVRIGDVLHAGFDCAGPRHALREELRARSYPLLGQVIEPKMRAFLKMSCDEHLDEDDWLEAMAMNLVTKPPGNWSDHDFVLFESLVAERARWFKRLELLYHELHQGQGEGFEARRVTLTAPDGTETAELVQVDAATKEKVGDVLDAALDEVRDRLGVDGSRVLLGILADRLLSSASSTTEEMPSEIRKVGSR
jgi:hypothetical protein